MSSVTPTARRVPFWCAPAFALLLTLPALAPASAIEYPLRSAPVVDGVVITLRSAGDIVYVGGWFTQVGERTGNTARIDLVTGTARHLERALTAQLVRAPVAEDRHVSPDPS